MGIVKGGSVGAVIVCVLAFIFVDFAVAQIPGTLDSSFDPAPGANGPVNSVSLQADGKVIIGGAFTQVNGIARNRIARLNVDGSVDSTFDPGSGPNDDVFATAIQPDGKIIIGGRFGSVAGNFRARLARLNANGVVDTSFNSVNAVPNNFVLALAIQPDGKIVVGGLFNREGINNITRLLPNGAIDSSFDPGVGTNGRIFSVRVQRNGKIVIGGWFTVFNGRADGGVDRLNGDGTFDSTFNPGTSAGGNVSFALPQPDGKILIGGRFSQVSGQNYLARLNVDGSADPGFASSVNNFCTTAELQLDGKIVVGGLFTTINNVSRNRIARLHINGAVDTGFDPGTGFAGTLLGYQTEVRSLKLQTSGRVIAGGAFTLFDGATRFGVARLFGTPFGTLSRASARADVRTGENVLISDFVLAGSDNTRVLLRGLGPSLSSGVTSPLQDPVLELHHLSGGLISRNNDWRDSQGPAIAATGLSPTKDQESAIIATLAPGSYRVVLRGRNRTTGIGMWELIGLGAGPNVQLARISSRGFAGMGENALIVKVGVASRTSQTKLLFRGLGPSFETAVSRALRNPVLEFSPPHLINDNWRDSQQAQILATGRAPTDDREAAIVRTVTPGNFTSIVHGRNSTDVGTGLADVFVLTEN